MVAGRALLLFLLAVGGMGFQASQDRGRIAPWNVPDAPNLYRGDPKDVIALREPSGLLKAGGGKIVTSDGLEIELVAVARRRTIGRNEDPPSQDLAWRPEGSPYYGPPLSSQPHGPGELLDDKGSRTLTFRLSSPRNLDLDTFGYVPDGPWVASRAKERHGWDELDSFRLQKGQAIGFSTSVVVDDRQASRYRFAYATGDFEPCASVAVKAGETDTRVLASGPWGTLRRIAPAPPTVGKRGSYRPSVSFVVDPPVEPSDRSYRIRLLDAGGRSRGPRLARASRATVGTHPLNLQEVVRVEVQSRPYRWIEFSGVRFDPDPSQWEPAYWGQEGFGKAVRVPGVGTLEGIVRPVAKYTEGSYGPLYAPDGKPWRGRPGPSSGGWSFPEYVGPAPASACALFRLDPYDEKSLRRVRTTVYASTSAVPGEGLGKILNGPGEDEQLGPVFGVPYLPDGTMPYVQFAVRPGDVEWRSSGAITPFRGALGRADQMDGVVTAGVVYRVSLRRDGSVDTGRCPPEGGYKTDSSPVRWDAGGEARLVAVLRSGGRQVMQANAFDGQGGRDYEFVLSSEKGVVYSLGENPLRLADVAAFVVETRAFGAPVFFVAKAPRSR